MKIEFNFSRPKLISSLPPPPKNTFASPPPQKKYNFSKTNFSYIYSCYNYIRSMFYNYGR